MKNYTINNDLDLFDILFTQFGNILAYEASIIFCNFFVQPETTQILQIVLIPIFILYLMAKFNKPILSAETDLKNQCYIFRVAQFGRIGKEISIPFNDIRINDTWKWLINYYSNVIEIKDNEKTKMIIPKNKMNKQFIERFIEMHNGLNSI